MARLKGAKHKNRQTKQPRSKRTLSQRFRRLKEKDNSKKSQRNSSTAENSPLKEQTVNSCSVFGCTEQFKVGSNIGFFKFPADEIRRDLWIRAVKQVNWSPSFASVLCGKHFQTGKPSKNPAHPDYVPNIFVATDSAANHLTHSSTVQIEESQCIIHDSNEIEGRPSKDSIHPSVVPNLVTCTNSVEKHNCHSSTSQIKESQCVIYDAIKIDQEFELLSSDDISEGPKKDEISILKPKHNQAHANVYTLRKQKVDIRKLTVSSSQQQVIENYVTEKEEEISKLKKELKEAYKEISFLQSEKNAWQNYITDRITDRIFKDTSKLRFFTGLNSNKDFQLLTELLHDVDTTITSVSVSSQLLIVLMRLQLNLKYPDLADRFQSSANTIRRICENMIPHLESKLKTFLPITVGMRQNVLYSYTNTNLYWKLYWTVQRYHRSNL